MKRINKIKMALFGSLIVMFSSCVTPGINENLKPETPVVPQIPEQPVVEKPIEKPADEIPQNVLFAEKLQNLLLKQDVKGAIALFDNMPAELKNDQDLQVVRASLYISDGDYVKASATANEILSKDGENVSAMEILAVSSHAAGDSETYNSVSNKLLAKDPQNPAVNNINAEKLMSTKKFKPAKKIYGDVLKVHPDDEDALYGYALCSYYTDDLKTSKQIVQNLIERNPYDSASIALLAKLYADQNSYALAVQEQEKALKLDPNNYNYLLDLGLYYIHMGNTDEAVKAWKKAVKIDSSYFLAYAYLAGAYDDAEKFEDAIENYNQVIRTNPEYYFAYESIAILDFHTGKYKDAIDNFSKALRYSENYSYRIMIAASYYKLKDPINAKKVLAAGLKKMEKDTLEYNIVRFYNDNYTRNAENQIVQQLNKEDNRNNKGKVLFYMGLYYELNGSDEMAKEYYAKVAKMQAPMFFEYRLAEWGLK